MLSRVFIDMTLLRGLVGTVTPLFVDTSPLLEFVEGMVPKRFVVLPGVEAFEGFTAVIQGFLVLAGLVGTGVFPFAGALPFARFAHVLLQYKCTMAPSLYLGFFLQCLGKTNHSVISPTGSERPYSRHITKGQDSTPCSRSSQCPYSVFDLCR